MKLMIQRQIRWLAFPVLLALAGCALGPPLTNHSFSYDAFNDSPDAEILNYRYGDSRQPGARGDEEIANWGHVGQRGSINGRMLRGDFLYVKWRIRKTGQVYEDTVDLRSRLPQSITDHTIHFVVKGPQLYVYLISPERRPADWPPNGPRMFQYLKVYTIYPDQSKSH
ncbi:MAG TPA: hypothetical protein VI279_01665 [Rhodocyclaceae bacterium]